MAAIVAAIVFSVSCKKGVSGGNSSDDSTTGSPALYDSMYLYAQQMYLWESQLTQNITQFNPQQYLNNNDSLGLSNELFAIVKNVKDSAGNYYEYVSGSQNPKYSYIINTSSELNGGGLSYARNSSERSSTTINDSKGNDLGLFLASDYSPVDNQTEEWFVWYVNTGSPAQRIGLRRGDVIDSLNGKSYGFSTADQNALNDILTGDTLSIVTKNLYTGVTKKYPTITKGLYNWNPILKDTVIVSSSYKVGYLALQAFTDSVSANTYLLQAFHKFDSSGINKLIIDLRYNHGGFVATSHLLANLIAPSKDQGKVLYREHYNSNLNRDRSQYTSQLTTLLKAQEIYGDDGVTPTGGTYYDYSFKLDDNTYFVDKKGAVDDLGDVCFIVSDETASASELLINSLKPYLNVSLIGVYNTQAEYDAKTVRTYGKPVGFFPIHLGKFSIYSPNFYTENADGFSNYYDGFLTDANGFDDVTADFASSTTSTSAFVVAMQKIIPNYQPLTTNYSNQQQRLIRINPIQTFNPKRLLIGNINQSGGIMIGRPRIKH